MVNDMLHPDVAQLIDERIDSVAELEALLLMRQSGSEPWKVDVIAKRLYVDAATASSTVDTLCRRGFLTKDGGSYVYAPASAALCEAVDRLAATYVQDLVAVTRRIHAKSAKSAKAFADAFRLRKDT